MRTLEVPLLELIERLDARDTTPFLERQRVVVQLVHVHELDARPAELQEALLVGLQRRVSLDALQRRADAMEVLDHHLPEGVVRMRLLVQHEGRARESTRAPFDQARRRHVIHVRDDALGQQQGRRIERDPMSYERCLELYDICEISIDQSKLASLPRRTRSLALAIGITLARLDPLMQLDIGIDDLSLASQQRAKVHLVVHVVLAQLSRLGQPKERRVEPCTE